MTRSAHRETEPRSIEEARRRLGDLEREIEKICRQLGDEERRQRFARQQDWEEWASRARAARERLRADEVRAYRWIVDRHLELLRQCAATLETIEDLSDEEETLLKTVDRFLENE